MAEALHAVNLGDPNSMYDYRELLVANLPEILAVAGATDQIQQLERGQHDRVVEWFTGYVSTGAHGANAGAFGLTEEQTRQFNPLAQQHGLAAPGRLWLPGDTLPLGAKVGDYVNYNVEPDYASLPAEVFKSPDNIAVDARFDGTIGRVDAAFGVAVRSEAVKNGGVGRVTVLTGMRAIKPDEGNSGLYKQFLMPNQNPDMPTDEAFPSATDATIAILRAHCSKFEQFYEVVDPEAGRKTEDRRHPKLGGREWIARYYNAIDAQTGAKLLITVVNGEPIAPTGKELNRSKTEPAPRAAQTLKDYVRLPLTWKGQGTNFEIVYAHKLRIAQSLMKIVSSEEAGALGVTFAVGNMPQKATWDKEINGKHNGGTLGYKEIIAVIKSSNGLLGFEDFDISSHGNR